MPATQTAQKDPVIVVLQLTGGNDYVNTVSFGPSLPRALVVQGVPVACVAGPLERYGFLPTIQGEQRKQVLDRFASMYKPAIGTGPVMDYMSSTGLDSLKGEDILKVAP